jgi:tRNA (uracil-5-)-methyltransferase TRM9
MDNKTINQLNQLNLDFYEKVATDFNESRQYFWSGWEKILPLLDNFSAIRVADIGCGNGRFGKFLQQKCPQIKLSYTGIDTNQELLNIAQETLEGKIPALHLQKIDIVKAMHSELNFLGNKKFQLITCFGVVHHIPSFTLRLKLLQYLLNKLEKNGYLIISFWQFTKSDRLKKKIVARNSKLNNIQLDWQKLETNDYILNWLKGKSAYRYCHLIDNQEQNRLIQQSNSQLVKTYDADGKEGNLNQYVILAR